MGLALAVYIAFECVLRVFQMPMVLFWSKMHLVDRAYLLAHPLDSLIYLHAQPPVLNGIAMIVLHVAALTGITEAAVASGVFAILGFGCFYVLLQVTRLATGSWIASSVCGALLLLNPAFAFYRHRLLYETPAMLAVLLTSWSWLLFIKTGRRRYGVGLAFSLALLCATKSLFHPLLALLIALLAVCARWVVSDLSGTELWRRYAGGLALAVVLVLLWPAKNQLVFGHFGYGSWLGFNLTVRMPIEPYAPFYDFVESGKIHPSLKNRIAAFEGLTEAADLSIVRARKKPSFPKVANWNHLAILYTTAELERRGIEWRLQHFGEWMRMAAGRYFMAMRPSFAFPYRANEVFPASARYDAYATQYRDIFYPNLRPWLERIAPSWFVHRYAILLDEAIPYSPFAFAFPCVLILFTVFAVRRRREPIGWFVGYCALAAAWTVLVPMLTDGVEGNRMRLATAPLVAIGVIVLIQHAVRRSVDAKAD